MKDEATVETRASRRREAEKVEKKPPGWKEVEAEWVAALSLAMKSLERSGVAEDLEWSAALEDEEWSGGGRGWHWKR